MKRFTYIGLISLLALVVNPPAFGQSPVPLTGRLEQKKVETPLPPPALDAAREYLEIMTQLQEIFQDYASYASEFDPDAKEKFAAAIARFAKGMQKGAYSTDYTVLVKDINAYVDELRILEKELARVKPSQARQEAQLAENLRRELSMISTLVSEEVSKNLQECSAYEAAISAYLQAELADRVRATAQGSAIEVGVDVEGDTIYVVSHDRNGSKYTVVKVPQPPSPPGYDVPSVPPVPTVPPVPPVPGVSWTPVPPRGTAAPDMVGSVHTMTGTLTYSPDAGAITISVPTGDLLVRRATDDAISVSVAMEVSAKTRADEKAFIAAARLNLNQNDQGHFIDLALPRLKDPDTRLLRSLMTVLVPDDSRLICQNSFGDLTVTQVDGVVSATGNHSNMVFLQIDGQVSATNSMGTIRLEQIDGVIEAVNSYGVIEISECDAETNVENTYGDVLLENSSGTVVIENSGNIEVRDHDGQVMLNNRNGKVDVASVTGDLIAYNSYQPLTIRDVDGDVKLENANALILARDVSGRLNAANRYGQISVRDVAGLVDISNEYGRVDLYFAEEIPARSRISTTSDSIAVWLNAGANALVKAETLDGNITSYFPIELSSHGERTLGIIKLGDGRNRIDLSGTYGSIVVHESR